jgi:uncharacterized protein YkwD
MLNNNRKGFEMLKDRLPIVAIAFLIVGCGETSISSPTTTPADNETITQESMELLKSDAKQKILKAINKARSEARDCHDGAGVVGPSKPLVWNTQLYLSAYEHSNDLAKSDTFSHYGSGTIYDVTASNLGISSSTFYQRIQQNGYVEYSTLGENIAGGQKTIDEVMEAWLKSPKHCANIMNDNFKEVGVAVVVEEGTQFGIYWTQNFGAK